MESKTVELPAAFVALGISRGHGYKLAREGALPGIIRLGTRMRMSRAVLERLLNGEQAAAGDASGAAK